MRHKSLHPDGFALSILAEDIVKERFVRERGGGDQRGFEGDDVTTHECDKSE